MAEAGRDRTSATLAARRSELRLMVAGAFVSLQEAEALERLAGQKLETIESFRRAVGRRVDAGKVSPIEREKVGSDAGGALIEAQDARQRTTLARGDWPASGHAPMHRTSPRSAGRLARKQRCRIARSF
ncbi:hypothetical protein [Cupriavidus basilensis]